MGVGGYGIDYSEEGGEAVIGHVAEKGESQVAGLRVDPLDASGHEALQSLDVGCNQGFHLNGHLYGDEGANRGGGGVGVSRGAGHRTAPVPVGGIL